MFRSACEAGCGEMDQGMGLVLNFVVPRWRVEFICTASLTGQSHGFIVVFKGSERSMAFGM